MSTEIIWDDPPPSRAAKGEYGRWVRFVETLQESPGKWAIAIAGIESARVGTIQSRLKRRGCEATSRAQDDGTYTLWARWPEDKS